MSFEEIMRSFPAAADYLSAIYLIHRDKGSVSNSRLASWLNVSRPAVTQAVSRLKKLELITQERYSDIALTESGKIFAEKMLRRHYLLEHFLMIYLNMSWHEIDEEAKLMQNSISDNFEEKMFQVLGKPATCPHGNPIPGVPEEAAILAAPPLTQAEPGKALRFIRITEEGEETENLLDFIYNQKMKLGNQLIILEKTQQFYRLEVRSEDGTLLHKSLDFPASFAQFLTWVPAA